MPVQETWILTHPATADEITIDLLDDGETVKVDGGDGEGFSSGPEARDLIVQKLLPKYEARGYQLAHTYEVDPDQP